MSCIAIKANITADTVITYTTEPVHTSPYHLLTVNVTHRYIPIGQEGYPGSQSDKSNPHIFSRLNMSGTQPAEGD